MSVLRNLETKLADLVEGTFGRVFRSEVRPVELARKLAREMDQHRTESLSHVYAPNEFSVWLSPRDRARYEGVEAEVIDELCAYLLEPARREDLVPPAAPPSGNWASRRPPPRSSRPAPAAAPGAGEPPPRGQPAASARASEPLPS